MSSTATSTAAALPRTMPALYRHILRTSRGTFQNDAHTMAAWRQYVRQKMPAQAEAAQASAADGTLSEQFVAEWLDVAKILRMNIVQGIRKQGTEDVYQLRFTPDTELGSNDSIKKNRNKQLADLKASKGIARCGGSSASASSSSSSSTSPSFSSATRSFSTSARFATPRAADKLKARPESPLPHPPAHFPTTTVLADGSSISMMTTSPRSISRLTRDPTNHPLWNPALLEKGKGAGGMGEDEAGRMERFRRRFGGAEAVQEEQQQTAASKRPQQPSAAEKGRAANTKQGRDKAAEPSAAASAAVKTKQQGSMFGLDDLSWMSGGRQANAGTPLTTGKGKGKKK